jgi:hypothetical protein
MKTIAEKEATRKDRFSLTNDCPDNDKQNEKNNN